MMQSLSSTKASSPKAMRGTQGENQSSSQRRCGTVALIGQANVGKSTLFNQLLTTPLAIVTPKAQTTRTPLRGVVQGELGQMVLIDTAGMVIGHQPMARALRYGTEQAVAQADVLVWIIDVLQDEAQWLASKAVLDGWLAQSSGQKPLLIVCNKVDQLQDKAVLLPLLARCNSWYPQSPLVPIAAKTGDGLSCLEQQLWQLVPSGEPQYDEAMYTDASERYLCGELIREQLLWSTQQEVPHSVVVLVESFRDERTAEGGRVWLDACIVVNSAGQKGIVIGRRGQMIKTIGMRSRAKIARLLQAEVVLRLRVVLDRHWKDNPRSIDAYGIGRVEHTLGQLPHPSSAFTDQHWL